MKFFNFFFLALLCFHAKAQHIQLLTKDQKTSIRGLSAFSDRVIWISGSKGTVGRSEDGGKTWEWIPVKNFETRDFRDIEAFDQKTAVIMAVGEPAIILKTQDAGKTWKLVFSDSTNGMFLDAMDFQSNGRGIVIGDPVNGKFFLARTGNNGDDWEALPSSQLPIADSGEACFAASGTNIRLSAGGDVCWVSGGLKSRLFIGNHSMDLPLLQGKTSTGGNSVAVYKEDKPNGLEHLIVVGGDFEHDTLSEKNCSFSKDGGRSWKNPARSPHGYRSCIAWLGKRVLVCCGTSGVDISKDDGLNWELVSKESFHVCQKAKNGNTVFLAGANGRIGKLVW